MKVLDLSHHPLDVRSSRWLDLSRKGNHGTPYGRARPYMIAPGVMGYWFDGSSGYIRVPAKNLPSSYSQITYEFWAKYHNLTGELFTIERNNTDTYFQVNGNGVTFRHADIGDGATIWSANLTGVINEWHYYVFTWDGQNTGIYFDGDCKASELATGTIIYPADKDLYIGACIGGCDPDKAFVKGIVALVCVHDRGLSQGEVRENMYRSPIYRMLRGLPHSMIYTKVPWKQTQGGIYVP